MQRRIASLAAILVLTLVALPAPAAHAETSFINASFPGNAPTTGGISVTIFGGGFTPSSTVYFGTTASPSVEYISGSMLSAAVPAGTGTVSLTIRNGDGTSSPAYSFTYTGGTGGTGGSLAIASVSPSTGLTTGGTPVTIAGSGFVAPITVSFGGNAAVTASLVNSTTITAVAPAGVVGPAVIVVGAGDQASLYNGFSYSTTSPASVTVTSVNPGTVALGGGTPVQITGNGFASGATVSFGGYLGSGVVVYSATLIGVVTPNGPVGTVPIVVTNPNGNAGVYQNFVYGTPSSGTVVTGGQPSIQSISPTSGSSAGGTQVTIYGSGFSTNATVTFGTVPATSVNVASSTMITAIAPANAVGPVTVLVSNSGGQLGGLTNGYTYIVAVPLVTGISPTSALPQGGSPITINGSGFVPGATVIIGGGTATAVTVVSPTQINATTPAGTVGTAVVLVINPGGAISGLATTFSYSTSAPVISAVTVGSVTPSTGPIAGGTSVTIVGSGFATGATVLIGGITATASVLGPTQIIATTPATALAGPVAVSVTNPGGSTVTLQGGFYYSSGTTTTPPATSGGPTTPGVPSGGSGLFVFKGGSNADLVAASGCNAATAVFWTTDSKGAWIGYLPSVPIAIVNAAWNALFPNGLPANTPIFARCA